ncbi:MAG: hypothetical protein NC432_14045 [Roseburia sp.]|nr:hypothetical protein [Roseburia sp.]MCM1099627.1 hypothetical protein [Ruminococcus flavefaciens]
MKKSTIAVVVILLVAVVGVVGVFAILTGKARSESLEAIMTPVQKVLATDLDRDYPGTVKEVVKLYTEIEKCFYNEECTEEEIEQLGMMARKLYDDELLEANDVDLYLIRLKEDISTFKKAKRRLNSVAVASAANVDTFTEDGYSFARIYCGYTVREGNNASVSASRVFLLRRDENRRWKIYGWESADKVSPGEY